MWRRRTKSLSDILNLRSPHHIISKIVAQLVWRPQIHLPAEQLGKLTLHYCEPEITYPFIQLEFHEDIHIARLGKPVGQHGTKQSQLSDSAAAAEIGDFRSRWRECTLRRRSLGS